MVLWGVVMKDSELEIKEELRRFLVYDLHINPSSIEKIEVSKMVDGQLRNINISFIPNIRGNKDK